MTLKNADLQAIRMLFYVKKFRQSDLKRGIIYSFGPVMTVNDKIKIFAAACLSILLFCLSMPAYAQSRSDSVNFGKFGKVALYKPSAEPREVVLFISGDAGWKSGVVDMARQLSDQGALVLGIDILRYIRQLKKDKRTCYYLSGDFEILSEYVQKKLQFKQYLTPILVGYSSGATMSYAVLAQSPDNTYKGAMALGFDPEIDLNRPLCKGSGLRMDSVAHGYNLLPRSDMNGVFVALNGDLDKYWKPEDGRKFMATLKYGKLYELPKVGHGFSVPKNWAPQFLSGYHYIITTYSPPVPHSEVAYIKSLPIFEIPTNLNDPDMPMMIAYSGDGGWRGFINSIAQRYSSVGIPVVGVDVLKYFWNESPPEKSAKDLSEIIAYYSKLWNRKKIVLIGYSFGADVLPFIYNNLPADVRENVVLLTLMSPSGFADFLFHFTDWLDQNNTRKYKLSPEVKKITGPEILFIFGKDEKETLSDELNSTQVKIVKVLGDHHYNYSLKAVTDPVLLSIDKKPKSSNP